MLDGEGVELPDLNAVSCVLLANCLDVGVGFGITDSDPDPGIGG
jgi:hypothetical protein